MDTPFDLYRMSKRSALMMKGKEPAATGGVKSNFTHPSALCAPARKLNCCGRSFAFLGSMKFVAGKLPSLLSLIHWSTPLTKKLVAVKFSLKNENFILDGARKNNSGTRTRKLWAPGLLMTNSS